MANIVEPQQIVVGQLQWICSWPGPFLLRKVPEGKLDRHKLDVRLRWGKREDRFLSSL